MRYNYIDPALNIGSGMVGSGDIGPNAVVSGNVGSGAIMGRQGGGPFNIASGTIGTFDIGASQITTALIADGTIITADIASGQITQNEVASGLYLPVIAFWLVAQETVSGVRAVSMLSGQGRVAMAGVSGRWPAIGIAPGNALATEALLVYKQGGPVFPSQAGFSGRLSGYEHQSIWLGTSGQLVVSGPAVASGDVQQTLGVCVSESGFIVGV